MNQRTAQDFGGYDVVAHAAAIAARAEQRYQWRTRWREHAMLDRLATFVVWGGVALALIVGLGAFLGSAWLVERLAVMLGIG